MTTQEILQGVHDWTNGKIVYDISVAHPDGQGNPTKYANLTAALGTGGANIPEALRKGGMSVKFVLSSDNKYVQYRSLTTSFSTSESDWEEIVSVKATDSSAESDFDISDEQGKVLVRFANGHVKVKYFDSADNNESISAILKNVGIDDIPLFDEEEDYEIGDVVRYNKLIYKFTAVHEAGEWNVSDVVRTNILEGITTESEVYTSNYSNGDYGVCDGNGNVIFRAKDGHIESKKFSSKNLPLPYLVDNEAIQLIESFACGSVTGQGYARHKKLVVAHISDTHNDSVRFQRFAKAISQHSIIDFGIHTGDVNQDFTDNNSWFIEDVIKATKPIYLAAGNHEYTSYSGSTPNADVKAKYFDPIVSKIGNVSTHNYYYIDNSSYGATIRFIFINQWDYTESYNGGYYNGIFSQEQINWLISTLQDCKTNNYYAVICSHQKPCKVIANETAFYQSVEVNTTPNNNFTGDILGDIVNAYKHGGILNKTYAASVQSLPTITLENVTFAEGGKFIAYINGHNHGDYCGYSTNYSDQLILNINAGYAYRYPTAQSEYLFSDLPRNEDDFTQDCYNMYVFDVSASKVHVVRVGSNKNYALRDRKYYSYNF